MCDIIQSSFFLANVRVDESVLVQLAADGRIRKILFRTHFKNINMNERHAW